jgi:signal transduction histidine kinase
MDGTKDPDGSSRDALLEAVIAVASDLDLQHVLQRIVTAAVTLADATYGALGVLSVDGQSLARFITVGIDDEGVARIGPPPKGLGVLGELIRTPLPLRLADLAGHPSSHGFPANHPPMYSFLGVPVRVGSEVFGNLYLTEKRDAREFTAEDERVMVALAAAAGVAIKNAHLYDESRRRTEWRAVNSEVLTALLTGAERSDVLELVTRRVCEVVGAEHVLLAIPEADGWAAGHAGDEQPAVLDELLLMLPKVLNEQRAFPVRAGGREGVALPVGAVGVLVCLWHEVPSELHLVDLEFFGAQAAVALELAERRRQVERFAVVEDRDRIARDLHDLVIQRLFATGMLLQSAVRLTESSPQEVRQRVDRAVDELDGTIRELRSTIYGLQAPTESRPSLRSQVLLVVDAASVQLGFAPSLRMDGLLDTFATADIADNVLATLREALSNVARHAHATHVDVGVRVDGKVFTVEVVDDGLGMARDAARSGLVNLASRAEQLRGSLRVSSSRAGGTALVWQVPCENA